MAISQKTVTLINCGKKVKKKNAEENYFGKRDFRKEGEKIKGKNKARH